MFFVLGPKPRDKKRKYDQLSGFRTFYAIVGIISIWYFDNKHILNAQSEAEDI